MLPQNLIFDADDTLWDNNVLFERAIEHFVDHLASTDLPREHIRARLDEIEKNNSHRYGYGLTVFEHSLAECLTAFRGHPRETDHQVLRVACAPIRAQQVTLLDGVLDTLRTLSQRHRLYLLTKGDPTEQTGKIEASGIAELFTDIAIVPEKDTAVYRDFAAQRALQAETTWMIGNSPRSDIWPALQAGLGAILVPHPMTWSLEHRELPGTHPKFGTVTPFAQLTQHF